MGNVNIVTSALILKEIEKVLLYPKIAKRIGWSKDEVNRYIQMLPFFTEEIILESNHIIVEKDPNDSPILSTLVESGADYLVTGDKALLEFYPSHSVISVNDFYNIFYE